MAVGTAFFAEFGFEDIQNRSLSAIVVAGLLARKASLHFFPYQPYPLFVREADSRHAAVVVLIRIGKTDNLLQAHRAESLPNCGAKGAE